MFDLYEMLLNCSFGIEVSAIMIFVMNEVVL